MKFLYNRYTNVYHTGKGAMMEELTVKQQQILQFVHDHVQRYGYPPSLREIGKKMKIKSPRGVAKHLMALEKKGHIKRGGGLSRGITLANVAVGRETPIIGRIAAGEPIVAVENVEGTLMLDSAFSKIGQTFLLRVKGLSMKDAGILDGDLVLVRQQPVAEHGDMVAALVNDEATVKYFRKRSSTITLDPANPEFKPLTIRKEDQFSIIGKVIASLRIIDGKLFNTILSKHPVA